MQKKNIRFSVIIPLYNKAPHIKKTIKSGLSQNYEDFEIIVVDDGSLDDGGDIVANINDPRVRLVRQENAGVSVARNKGIELSKGEYIAFLDADDWWFPNHLQTLNNLIDIYPDCGMYATGFSILYEDGSVIDKPHIDQPKGWHKKINLDGYLDFVLHDQIFWTGTVCVRKSVFSEIGKFEVGLVRGQDIDMWLRVAANFDTAFINRVTAIYNLKAVNRSPTRFNPSLWKFFERLSRMVIDERFNPSTQKKLYEYYSMRMISRGRESLIWGYEKEASYCAKESIRTKKFRKELSKLLILLMLSKLRLFKKQPNL